MAQKTFWSKKSNLRPLASTAQEPQFDEPCRKQLKIDNSSSTTIPDTKPESMRIAVWNITPLDATSTMSRDMITKSLQSNDVVCLLNTKMDWGFLETGKFMWYTSGRLANTNHGVAILVRSGLDKQYNLVNVTRVSEFVCTAQFKWKEKHFQIVCCLLPKPNNTSWQAVKSTISTQLSSDLFTILLGDFQAVIGAMDFKTEDFFRLGTLHRAAKSDENGLYVISMSRSFNLRLSSSFDSKLKQNNQYLVFTNVNASYKFECKDYTCISKVLSFSFFLEEDENKKSSSVKLNNTLFASSNSQVNQLQLPSHQNLQKQQQKEVGHPTVPHLNSDIKVNKSTDVHQPKASLQFLEVERVLCNGFKCVINLLPTNRDTFYSAIGYHLFNCVDSEDALEDLAVTLQHRTIDYIRNNRSVFFSDICSLYSNVFPDHGLDDNSVFEHGCLYLNQSGHSGKVISAKAIASLFNIVIVVLNETSNINHTLVVDLYNKICPICCTTEEESKLSVAPIIKRCSKEECYDVFNTSENSLREFLNTVKCYKLPQDGS